MPEFGETRSDVVKKNNTFNILNNKKAYVRLCILPSMYIYFISIYVCDFLHLIFKTFCFFVRRRIAFNTLFTDTLVPLFLFKIRMNFL